MPHRPRRRRCEGAWVGDGVGVARGCRGDVAVEQVAADGGGVALGGGAEAAGAGRDHVDDGAGGSQERAFAGQVTARAVGRGERDDGGGAGLAAEQAERRGGHALHAQRADGVRPVQEPPGATRAAAAAILPGAAGVRIDLVALHAHGEGHLQHLDRRVHGVGDARGDHVDAVLVGARAEPALDGLVGDVAAARARVDAAEREDGGGALAAGHHLVGPHGGQRAHHHVGHAVRDLVVGIDDGEGNWAFTTEPFGAFTSMVRQQPELGGMRLLGSTAVLRPQ